MDACAVLGVHVLEEAQARLGAGDVSKHVQLLNLLLALESALERDVVARARLTHLCRCAPIALAQLSAHAAFDIARIAAQKERPCAHHQLETRIKKETRIVGAHVCRLDSRIS